MKINNNVVWFSYDNVGYIKKGYKLFKISDLDIEKQNEYWKLLNDNRLEDIAEKIKEDELLNKFVALLRSIGATYDESNIWTSFEKDYQMNLKKTDEFIVNMKIGLLGDDDLVDYIQKHDKHFSFTNNEPNFGIIIGRKENLNYLIKKSHIYHECNIPYLTILIEEFSTYIGPLVIPGKTSCLNCVYDNEIGNLFINDRIKHIYSKAPESRAHILSINLDATLAFANTQILKYIFRMQKNQSSLMIVNNIIEFDWLNDNVTWHHILRNLECNICYPEKEKHISNWLNMEDKHYGDFE